MFHVIVTTLVQRQLIIVGDCSIEQLVLVFKCSLWKNCFHPGGGIYVCDNVDALHFADKSQEKTVCEFINSAK